LLDDIALSRRHVVLERVEILARLPLPFLLIDADMVVGSTAAELERLFDVRDELPGE
jgi:hypothetical protein